MGEPAQRRAGRVDDRAARSRVVARVEACLHEHCAAAGDFAPAVAHLLAVPGKRYRAQLTGAAAALGVDELDGLCDDAIALAAGVELLHEASLVHDDVCDGSLVRRNAPSIAARLGVRTAVRFGVWLAGRGLSVFGAVERRRRLGLDVASLLALAEGQLREAQGCDGDSLRAHREHYLAVLRGKTTTLIALACDSGARLAGLDDAERARLARFADAVGLAYQVLDDVRDVLAPPSLGKPGGTDAARGLLTWPVLEWLRAHPDGDTAAVSLDEVRRSLPSLSGELVSSGAVRRARDFAAAELAAGRTAIAPFAASPGGAWLDDLSRLDA